MPEPRGVAPSGNKLFFGVVFRPCCYIGWIIMSSVERSMGDLPPLCLLPLLFRAIPWVPGT